MSPQAAPAPGPALPAHWTDDRQDAFVLGMLLECEDDFVTGSVLCDKLDVPRPELLKRLDSLRARGYVIQTAGGRGYRLAGMPQGLSDRELAPLLSTAEVGRAIHHFDEVGSTNDEAHRLAEEGARHGEVVIAESQKSGRGRRGRSWIAPRGKSIALSVILRPALPAARAPEITIAAAVGLCEAARELGATGAQIKWPNDIECGGRKLAGVLTELRAEGEAVKHVVLGVGFNCGMLREDFPEELEDLATSLRIEKGEDVPRVLACARLLESLDEWFALHDVEGFGPVRDRWRQLSSTLGRRVRVAFESDRRAEGASERGPLGGESDRRAEGAPERGPLGGESDRRAEGAPERGPLGGEPGSQGGEPGELEGDAVDLAEDGALLLRTHDGALRRVMAGDVTHCRVL